MTDQRQIEIASKRKSNRNEFNGKRGETFYVESRILFHDRSSRSCIQRVLRDSFVHHFSRNFHGEWIQLGGKTSIWKGTDEMDSILKI